MVSINWFASVLRPPKLVYVMSPKDNETLSPQARYQRKRRQAGAVTFFPPDKTALVAAAKAAGKTQQDWLAEAVREKIARQVTREEDR